MEGITACVVIDMSREAVRRALASHLAAQLGAEIKANLVEFEEDGSAVVSVSLTDEMVAAMFRGRPLEPLADEEWVDLQGRTILVHADENGVCDVGAVLPEGAKVIRGSDPVPGIFGDPDLAWLK